MTEEIRESYRLLEVEPGAPLDAVKKAYRELLKVWHPDRFPNDPNFQKKATVKTEALNEAYQQITAYLAGNYTESRTSARARAAQEEATRAREAAEARQREEAARQAREAAEAKAREEARLREQRRQAEEWTEQQQQTDKESAHRRPTPPPIIPGASKTQRPPKKKTGWAQYIGVALALACFSLLRTQCDREKALDRTKSGAEAGDVSAQRSMGQRYENGELVQQNDAEAAKWYSKAAAQGDAWAQAQLGWMYEKGRGVPQNYEEAAKWYSKAAAQGNATAQNNMGIMCQNGQAVQRDEIEAYKWYVLAAAQGNLYAATNRDNLLPHLSAEQVAAAQKRAQFEKDFYEKYPDLRPYGSLVDAVATKLQAAGYTGESREAVMEKFAEEARKELARQLGSQPLAQRKQTSGYDIGTLKSSAEKGDAVAQNSLGVMYQDGQGVTRDVTEAYKWYYLAAAQGNANASRNRDNLAAALTPQQSAESSWRISLAQIRQFESTSSQADIEALKASAEQGDGKAQITLGWLCCSGSAVPQNYAEAVNWWRKAADQGLHNGQNCVGMMYFLGHGVQQDYSEAVKWFAKVAEQGEAVGQYNVGEAFEYGLGVQRDDVSAYAWYSLAAEQNNKQAIIRRDSVSKRLTPEQIAKARRMASSFKPAKQSSP